MGIVNLDFGTLAENDGDTLAVAFPKVQSNFEDLDTRATANAAAIAAHIVDADPHTQYVKTSVLSESIDDRVAALLVAGTNVTLTYNDAANTLEIASTGGGGGATNLAYTASPTNGIVTSDTGTDATLPLATGTNAGLMAPADFTKLTGLPSVASSQYVATRTALKALDTTSVKYAFLGEYPRYGVFAWRAANLSAQVTADPQEGRYLKADAIATTAGAWERIDNDYYVEHWGAVGDNATNDYTAIQAALDFMEDTARPGTLRFMPKLYLVGTKLIVAPSINLKGSSAASGTRITASHSVGAVVEFTGDRNHIEDLEIYASAGRTAGAATSGGKQNSGITVLGNFFTAKNCRIYNQPSHGFLASTQCHISRLEGLTCTSNLGHGICIDPGDENGDTPTVNGLFEIIQPSINSNAGHAIAVGRPSSSGAGANALRIKITNADCDGNGSNAALLYETCAFYLRGSLISTERCAISGGASKYTRGIYVQGYGQKHIDNRFFNLTGDTDAYVVAGADTTGVLIDGINVETSIAVLAVAINVGATVPALAVTAVPRDQTGYTTLMTTTNVQNIDLGTYVDIQHFTATGAFTWTKPSWAQSTSVVDIYMTSGGGGGGSGRRGAAASVRCGGGGGGSGVFLNVRTHAGAFGATVAGTVGAGGAGGAAQTVNSTNGVNGTAGGSSTFGTFRALGGNLGSGGTATNGTGGAAIGSASLYSAAGIAGGTASATGGVGVAGTAGTLSSSAGGGSGGGITSANAVSNGGAGGALSFPVSTTTATGGTAGTAGGNGGAGNAGAYIFGKSMGSGGGGGASSGTAAAGNGGNGINGSGGGGGGASLDGFNSGAGGNGGDGWVTIVTYK